MESNKKLKEDKIVLEEKKNKEKKLIQCMIKIYCRGNKHSRNKNQLICDSCQELLEYANMRIDKCPFTATKSFCSNCKVHCYQPQRREQIKSVMRYAGPRMLFVHPIMALKHMVVTIREKRKKKYVS